MLFSEPKIPQFRCDDVYSAYLEVSVLFSEPKIPQSHSGNQFGVGYKRFSALQRAENSSILRMSMTVLYDIGFSALQRAENSSMEAAKCYPRVLSVVSVLFSEPKIPQSSMCSSTRHPSARFSALQRAENSSMPFASSATTSVPRFSALQRAENSSIRCGAVGQPRHRREFQCSSASRKFLNGVAGSHQV